MVTLTGTGCGSDSCLPALGDDITGSITLASELPQNGTVTVTPLSMTFSVYVPAMENVDSAQVGFTFRMVNGVITSFSFLDQIPYGDSPVYRLTSDGTETSYVEGFAVGGFSVTALAGAWIEEPQG